jgi:hypothetical protein
VIYLQQASQHVSQHTSQHVSQHTSQHVSQHVSQHAPHWLEQHDAVEQQSAAAFADVLVVEASIIKPARAVVRINERMVAS